MQLSPRLAHVFAALGVDAEGVPHEVWTPAPFGQRVPEPAALVRWLAQRLAETPEGLMARVDRLGSPFGAFTTQLRDEALRTRAKLDAADAARIARAVASTGPLEATLGLGALARMSALVAAHAEDAASAVRACAPLLDGPRPVARIAALRLGEVGVTEGAHGRRARAVLEEALSNALAAAHDLGASGQLAMQLDPSLAELALPGMTDRVAAVSGRVVDLVAVLGALAAHREGLTARLSALAPQAPPFTGPLYVIAYLAALGAADDGPYLDEVRERLERAARDREPVVRALALEALGGHARAVPAFVDLLVSALSDGEETARIAAALALGEAEIVPDSATHWLELMIDTGDAEERLTATRALVRGGRSVPAGLIAKIRDPLVAASVRLLAASPADAAGHEDAFSALAEVHTMGDPDASAALDARVQPIAILVDALRGMPVARSAGWLARFAAGELAPVGNVFYQALDGCELVPPELLEAGRPLLAAIADGDEERAALAALVAARLYPAEPGLESLILERTSSPISWLALASLERLGEDTSEHLLAAVDNPEEAQTSLAIEALARCELGAAQAATVAAALVPHIRDDDPLSEAAHAALIELVERGVLRA